VNAVMNLQVPQNAEISLLDEDLLASQEGLCYMELLYGFPYIKGKRHTKP
jgi:hypothetical protein